MFRLGQHMHTCPNCGLRGVHFDPDCEGPTSLMLCDYCHPAALPAVAWWARRVALIVAVVAVVAGLRADYWVSAGLALVAVVSFLIGAREVVIARGDVEPGTEPDPQAGRTSYERLTTATTIVSEATPEGDRIVLDYIGGPAPMPGQIVYLKLGPQPQTSDPETAAAELAAELAALADRTGIPESRLRRAYGDGGEPG